ncbi:class I SAM-dependent methyltransferase [Rheinheimera aquimaris]|uniref:class I SAM-dependent methyltransferase n=1 Tax=Rheinheimera aquimaris TaxID=412437 RepID=UPI001E4862C2|nr:methyltransferase domain-containing protein [Rheinheimera aquimaris]MCD1599741.1 methyltransferase domain-containing protein [Rheinheimera aquimaris]
MDQIEMKITLFKSLRESLIPAVRFYLKSASESNWLPKLSRSINKKLYRLGIGSALNRYDSSWTLYSAKADAELYQEYSPEDIFCNFGAGAFYHHRWRNYDFPGQSSYYKAVQGVESQDFHAIDLCKPGMNLPLQNESVSLIYCSHTLEHLESERAFDFLKECYRILKPGAVIRLAVPSTDNDQKILSIVAGQERIAISTKYQLAAEVSKHLLTDSVHQDERQTYKLMQLSDFDAEQYYHLAVKAGISAIFSATDPGRHISYWDYHNVQRIAETLSFGACIPCYRGSSLAQPFLNLHVFDTTEPHISLYIELVK